MKFTVYKNDISDIIKVVTKCAAVKPQTPILSAVKITAQDGKLTLDATDFSLAAEAAIPANVEIAGTVCVDAKYLQSVIGKLPEDVVTFNVNGNFLEVTSGSAHFDLLTFNSEEYPTPKFASDNSFELRAPVLKKVIRQTVFAVATADDRPLFKGVNITIDGNTIQAVATNTHHVAVFKTYKPEGGSCNVVVPAPALKIIDSYLTDDPECKVTVSVNERFLSVHFDNIFFKTRLIEGEFPPIDRLLDEERPITADFVTAELKQALGRAQLVSSTDAYGSVQLSLRPDSITVSAQSETRGKTAESIAAQCSGEFEITFNVAYLLGFLNATDSSRTRASFSGKVAPAQFNTLGEENPEFVYIVTPVRA